MTVSEVDKNKISEGRFFSKNLPSKCKRKVEQSLNYSGKQKIGLNVLVAVNETAESSHFCIPSFSMER